MLQSSEMVYGFVANSFFYTKSYGLGIESEMNFNANNSCKKIIMKKVGN